MINDTPTTPITIYEISPRVVSKINYRVKTYQNLPHVENFEERVQRVGILNNSTVRAEEIWAREKCLRGP